MWVKLDKILNKKTANLRIDKKLENKKIMDLWPEAVASINKKLVPKTKAIQFKNGILKINCENFTVIAELHLQKKYLRDWFLNRDYKIKDIKFLN